MLWFYITFCNCSLLSRGVGRRQLLKMSFFFLPCSSASLKDSTGLEGSIKNADLWGQSICWGRGVARAAEHPLMPGCGRTKWKSRPSCLLLLSRLSLPKSLPLICDFGTSLHCINNFSLGLILVSLIPCSADLCYAWFLCQQLSEHRSLNKV